MSWAESVRGLLLDIDDTLVDTQSAMRFSCTVGAAAAWPRQPGTVHEALSGWFYDDPGGFFDAYTRGECDFADQRRARYIVACYRLGLEATGFETFEHSYRQAFAGSQELFSDAVAFLDHAREADVQVAFVTNSGDEQTQIKLDAVGLQGRGPVVTTDTLGVGKPDPAIFTHGLSLLGVAPEATIVVGDTLHTDVAGALNAGLRAAWLQRPGVPEPRSAGWGTPVDDPRVRIIAGLYDIAAWF